MIRVMLVDDHALVRTGFALLLDSADGIEVVAALGSGEEACRSYAEVRPDVIVLDVSMPGIDGFEVLSRLLARDSGARVLVLSAHDDAAHAARALAGGAIGYLTKRSAPDELVRAIRRVAAGQPSVEPGIAEQLAVARARGGATPLDVLTPREFQVFIALARGDSTSRIAETLSLAPSTVGTHLYNVKQKLGAANSAELALIAVRHGLLEA